MIAKKICEFREIKALQPEHKNNDSTIFLCNYMISRCEIKVT